jgi:hypothetical protein
MLTDPMAADDDDEIGFIERIGAYLLIVQEAIGDTFGVEDSFWVNLLGLIAVFVVFTLVGFLLIWLT